jgi:uncharacterized protein (TIGR03437 family)
MKNLFSKLASFFVLTIATTAVLVPVFRAQNLGSVTRISTVPDGAYYSVDGQIYNHATSAIWPAGSKHSLFVDLEQDGVQQKARFTFTSWQYSGGTLPGGNSVSITADPSVTDYKATFSVQYAISLVFYACPTAPCASPGTIYQGTTPFNSDQDIWVSAGGSATLLAVPNDGYVFAGWSPGPGQVIQGAVNKVTANTPVTVYPLFQKARPVTLKTNPPGLQVLADRTAVTTPITLDWGWTSVHSVGPVSPQLDLQGNWWVFSSWSDGGASTHAYTVASVYSPDSITATYVPGAPVAFNTIPAGLKLKIDGRDNWPTYSFNWGVGETHHFEAPTPQTDAQGRIWNFTSWSNGGAAAQDITVTPSIAGSGMRISATYTPVGHLTVNSTLAGLAINVDGNSCATPCDIQRPVGTSVRLSAPGSVPQSDAVRADFLGWPGSGSTATDFSVALTADPATIVAGYRTMNRLAASADPADGASWSLQPSSNDGFYDSQSTVSVAVSTKPGYRFHSWSGDLSGTKPVGVVAMTAPRAVQAQLDRVPYIAPTGVANAAGATPQTGVAAGSVVSIFGASFAPAAATATATPLTQTLGGVTVHAGDRLMPLFFVSPTQINVQLPDDLALGAATLTVSSQGLPDVQAAFTVVRNAPGVFGQAVQDQTFALAIHEDGTAVTTDAPALRGELLTVYGTGFGPADHARPEGFPVPDSPRYNIVDTTTATVGDFVIAAENAFVAPGRVGVDAVQFRLGDGAPSGTNANLHITVNGQDSNVVLLPVK